MPFPPRSASSASQAHVLTLSAEAGAVSWLRTRQSVLVEEMLLSALPGKPVSNSARGLTRTQGRWFALKQVFYLVSICPALNMDVMQLPVTVPSMHSGPRGATGHGFSEYVSPWGRGGQARIWERRAGARTRFRQLSVR